jgi:hypothetical protein
LRWGSRGKAGCKGRSRRGKGFQVEERRSVREQRSGEERRGVAYSRDKDFFESWRFLFGAQLSGGRGIELRVCG